MAIEREAIALVVAYAIFSALLSAHRTISTRSSGGFAIGSPIERAVLSSCPLAFAGAIEMLGEAPLSDMRVVLVEDHDLTRMGLKAALQQAAIEVIGEATTAAQGLSVLQDCVPDVAIIDIGLPDRDGIDLTRSLRQWQEQQSAPAIRVLILTMQDSEEAILAAFAAGADSYCLKDISGDRLLEALQATHEGNGWIDPAIANVVLKHVRQASPTAERNTSETVAIAKIDEAYAEAIAAYPLSERETEVLELIVAGYSNSQIGDKLFISMGTVKTHVRHILDKLCASDRTQAAVRALRSGLVK